MCARLLVLVLVLSALAPAWGAGGEASRPASVDAMRLSGVWQAAQARSVARLAAAPLDSRDFILADVSLKQQRAFTDYSGDISGRWIGVAAFLAPQYPQPLAALPALVNRIPAFQKADGHFGAEQRLPKIKGDRDMPILWGNGRLLIGLMEVYQRSGNRKALQTARRLGDYLVATDPVYDKAENIRAVGGDYGHSLATCYFQCIEGLVALGRATGENRYLDEARRIAELAASVDRFDGFHSHARLTTDRGLADLYAASGEARWLEAARRDWKIFMEALPSAHRRRQGEAQPRLRHRRRLLGGRLAAAEPGPGRPDRRGALTGTRPSGPWTGTSSTISSPTAGPGTASSTRSTAGRWPSTACSARPGGAARSTGPGPRWTSPAWP